MKQFTKEYIQSLLDKFMDGTTTLEEEDILRDYLLGDNVPEAWHDYRLLFQELEAMKPQTKTRHHWLRWSAAAAAVAAVVVFAAALWQPTEQKEVQQERLAAQADTTTVLRPEAPNEEPLPDTTALRKLQQKRDVPRKRRRKPEPTIHDYDRAYALMAKAEEERRQVEQQIAEARQEVLHVQLTAAGYTPITLEDGTIIYIEEPKEFFAYEE